MYETYFVNVSTGELYRSGSPKNDKCHCFYPEFNVEGWSQVKYNIYTLLKTSQNFGYAQGIISDKEENPLKNIL